MMYQGLPLPLSLAVGSPSVTITLFWVWYALWLEFISLWVKDEVTFRD